MGADEAPGDLLHVYDPKIPKKASKTEEGKTLELATHSLFSLSCVSLGVFLSDDG